MGELNQHSLNAYIAKYKTNIFVETGTGKGTGILYALKFRFDKYFSIEIMKALYDYTKALISNPKCTLINDNSLNGLTTVINSLSVNDKILFWLDAHFPGADFQMGSYDDKHEKSIKIPLENEIELIFNLRPNNKDVFILDDLRLYEEGTYELGSIDRARFDNPTLDKVYDIVKTTHDIKKDYRHQGFLILTPKGV